MQDHSAGGAGDPGRGVDQLGADGSGPGGSANDYDYCNADPINRADLDGRWPHWAKRAGNWAWHHKVDTGLTVLSFAPGIGEAASAYRTYRGLPGLPRRPHDPLRVTCRPGGLPELLRPRHPGRPGRRHQSRHRRHANRRPRPRRRPHTGDVTAEPLTDLIIGSGEKDLVTITADTDGDGRSDHLVATSNHPFYSGDHWTDAGDTQPATGSPPTLGRPTR